MKNRIVSLLLLSVLVLGMLSMTACGSDKKAIITEKDVGDAADAGYYSFYVRWQRDYYKQLLKNYGYDIGAKLDQPYSNNKTVRETIVDSAKTQFLSFLVITDKFAELNLTLPAETADAIAKQYEDDWIRIYGEDGMKNILETLGLTKEQFINLLSVQAKNNMILDYYYGEQGQTPITDEEKSEYFDENYQRFKYILLTTADDNDKPLPAAELQAKRDLSKQLLQQIQDGTLSMEEAFPQYSETYTKITDTMTADEKANAEESNTKAVTEGLITDKNGIFNQTLSSVYDVRLDSSIVAKLTELKNGDAALVELDNAIWIIQKYDLHEDDQYYEDREEMIYQILYGPDFNAKYTRWVAELDYKFDDEVLAELDPGTFTDLFSEVYNLETNATPQQ